jgi:nitrite reductase/ring-hydroxylating ferredoxin subunit
MAFVKVATLRELEKQQLMEVLVEGEPYALCRLNGAVYALNGTCPHQGGPLGEGMISGDGIMCPWHAWTFDCRTGINDVDPAERVQTYPVKVDGDDVLIDIA